MKKIRLFCDELKPKVASVFEGGGSLTVAEKIRLIINNMILTVNGIRPDENGNIEIKTTGSTVTVGNTETLEPGSPATVTNSGTDTDAILNFGIPKGEQGKPGEPGEKGDDGKAATVSVGTVNSLPFGSKPTVTNSGTENAAVLDFGIPNFEAQPFTSFYSAIYPDANGDLDPSRPMTTPTAASVTIKSKGDRIQSVQVNGFTQQAGTGDPSPTNVRPITVAAQDGTLPITLTGSQAVTENLNLTAPLCAGDRVESCVPSGCDKRVVLDGTQNIYQGNTASGWYQVFYNPGDAEKVPSGDGVYAYSDLLPAFSANYAFKNKLSGICQRIDGIIALSFNLTDYPTCNSVAGVKAYLQEHPLPVWYRSTAYTEANDIPVQMETHVQSHLIVDGTIVKFLSWGGGYCNISNPISAANSSEITANGLVTSALGVCANWGTNSAGRLFWRQSKAEATTGFTSADEANAFLAEQYSSDNPVVIVYKLSAPAIYVHDPVTLVAVPYTQADVDAANQLANTPSTLPSIDSPDVPMLLDETDNEDSAAQIMEIAANAVPVVGTYVVSSQNGTALTISLKAMQDGGDAKTIDGHTWEDIVNLVNSISQN